MTSLAALDRPAARRVVIAGAVVAVVLGAALSALVHPLLGVAAVLAAVVAPVVLASADLALAAVAAVITLLPFGALPLGIGFNPTLLDFALGAVYLVWAVRLATRERKLRLPPLWAVVAGFVALMVVALLAGTSNGMPTKNQLRSFAEMVLGAGLFLVVADVAADERGRRRAFATLVGLGSLSAAVGLGLYLLPDLLQVRLLSLLRVLDYPTGMGVLRYINDDPSRLQRATGTAIDPNSFGGMLAVVAALLVPQLLGARRPDRASVPGPHLVSGRAGAAMLAVVVAALLATVSRGSLVGLAAALGVIGLARDRRLLAYVVVGGLAIVLLAGVLPWTSAYVEHFTAGLRVEDRATQMRMGEYRDSLRLIERYPFLGVGFGGPRDIDLYRGVSSLYLIVAETMGIVGLAAFLATLAAVATRLALRWRRMAPGGDRALVLGCLAALAAALVSGVFDHYFFTYPHAFALLWLVAGLGVAASWGDAPGEPETS